VGQANLARQIPPSGEGSYPKKSLTVLPSPPRRRADEACTSLSDRVNWVFDKTQEGHAMVLAEPQIRRL